MKEFNASSITTDSKFKAALKDVFGGIASRNKQIQQLIAISLFKASQPVPDSDRTADDFRWLSELANSFEGVRGLDVQQFSLYVKAHVKCHVTDAQGKVTLASLAWDAKTKQFKKPQKGCLVEYVPLSGYWFEFGKKKTVAAEFSLSKSLASVIKKAAAQAKAGGLSPEDKALFDAIAGVYMAQTQAQAVPVTQDSPAWVAQIDANSENF